MRDTEYTFDLIEFPPVNVKLYYVHLKPDLTLEYVLEAANFLRKSGVEPIEECYLRDYYYYLFLDNLNFKNLLQGRDSCNFYRFSSHKFNVFLDIKMITIENDHPILKLMLEKKLPFICGMRTNPIEAINI